MTTDIHSAFAEATIDTFEALREGPQALTDPKVVKPLDQAFVFLSEVTGVSAQILFNNISRGAHEIISASDHVILVSGARIREMRCDTCARLLTHHGATPAPTYFTAVNDVEALAALHLASAVEESKRRG
jgi:hypothetical protein